MNKKSLANTLRQEYGFSWSEAYNIIDTVFGSIRHDLKNGNRVVLHDFGSFQKKEFSSKTYRDIHTGKLKVKAVTNKVKFRPSKNILELKEPHLGHFIKEAREAHKNKKTLSHEYMKKRYGV